MKNIDFKFIEQLEGFELRGYVPDPRNSQSGVTIASGFDLGARSKQEIERLFAPELATKLVPYATLKKEAAVAYLRANPLRVSTEEARTINNAAHKQSLERLVRVFNTASKTKFEDLNVGKATVIASVSFQYGDLAKRTPNFWKQVTCGDWGGAVRNLRNFGDRYATRRKKEADLLEKYLA